MRAEALALLGLSEQDWGPCYGDQFTHAQFEEKWRGTVPCPTEAEINAAVNSQAELDKKFNAGIDAQIIELETQVTQRRIREAIITGDKTFITDIDAQITTLRATRR